MSKTVGIIGGGPAGMVAAKEMLEAGLSPIIFEKEDTLGGVWRPETGQTWQGLTTNISKYTCAFSDAPWPEGTPDFPSAEAMALYLRSYAHTYGLAAYTAFRTPVQQVYPVAGKWVVETEQGAQFVDALVVASGIFHTPDLSAFETFKDRAGEIIHGAAYKSAAHFRGQKVTVVGNSFSGNEIAADLAQNGVSVTQIVRTPTWIIQKSLYGKPIDILFNTRASLSRKLPEAEALATRRDFFEGTFGNPGLSHPDLAVLPGHDAGLSISDTYLEHVRAQRISVVKAAFAEKVRPSDSMILCTGYKLDIPFFGRGVKEVLSYDARDKVTPILLNKETVHPDLPNLGFVGVYKGPYFGEMELQARWLAAIFSGRISPPSPANMAEGLAESRAIREKSPRSQFPRKYGPFTDSLAQEIGVVPDLMEESLEMQYLLNSHLAPAQYRVQGRGARRAVALSSLQAVQERLRRK